MMTSHEDIAIIGIGCRFPGATCLKEFWDVLSKGENHVSDVPAERWNANSYYDPDVESVGKSYTKRAGLIKNYAHFDNKLFGINESEARQMDPQQRQVLECTYMALENAGITRQQIAGQNVGVYIGAMNSDFTVRMTSNYDKIDHYSVAGLASSVIANRVSYVYDLTGPSMVIDTACSSSLVALHQAGLALRAGDCDLAICGGVSLILHPTVFLPLCKAQMLSASGQCHAFSADADGYARGEGCGIVVLKPLRQAIKDSDHIWATIMTGVNQDGQESKPITAPSANQQKMLLKNVYNSYNIDPKTVDYIEAHGTGTKLGDPVEISALGDFFAVEGHRHKRHLGSVKTNIGHLEPAAGVAGLIKVLLMMKEDTIVPSLHCDKPNELIDFTRFGFIVPDTSIPWVSENKVACINSFGFGGTNCHVILQSSKMKGQSNDVLGGHSIVSFSGCTQSNVIESIGSFLKTSHLEHNLLDLSYTSLLKREHFPYRKGFVVNSMTELQKQAQMAIQEENVLCKKPDKNNIVFVFCGMGTAWKGMCSLFMLRYPIFASTIDMIDRSLHRFVSWSLTDRLKHCYDVEDVLFDPIAIFACQLSLSKLWESLGVRPGSVVGQSIGEVAAAHSAGILSLEEAVRVIYHRSRVLAKSKGGKMLLVRNMDTQLVQKLCDQVSNVDIALFYSPMSCTVSGDSSSVDRIRSLIECKQNEHDDCSMSELPVSCAYHSHHMDQSQRELNAALVDLQTELPSIPMISSVDAHTSQQEMMSPAYWGTNVRQPVRFSDAIEKAVSATSQNVFIEIGPKPVLAAHLRDIFGTGGLSVLSLPSMEPRGNEHVLLKSICSLHEMNIDIRWQELFSTVHVPTPLPRYTFSHKKLLVLQPITEKEVFGCMNSPSEHLFVRKTAASSACTLSISPAVFSTVYEHKVHGIVILPGAVYAEAGFAIAKTTTAFGDARNLVVSVKFTTPLTLKRDTSVSLDVDVDEGDPERTTFIVHNADVEHVQGTVLKTNDVLNYDRVDLEAITHRCGEHVSGESVYQTLERSGFTYGRSFATIDYALQGRDESLTKLQLNPQLEKEMAHTVIHPAVLDGMLQSAAAGEHQLGEFLPVELSGVRVQHPMEKEMFVYSKMTHCTDSHTSFYLELISMNGTILAKVEKFTTKFIGVKSFDEVGATFKTGLMRIDQEDADMGNGDGVMGSGDSVVIFTDADLTSLKMPGTKHKLDYSDIQGATSRLDSIIGKVRYICFIFPVLEKLTMTGSAIQDELVKRILQLRLIIMHIAEKGLCTPVIIISEERKVGSSTGVELAGICLNEAMKGFTRCVLREYPSIDVQLVDVQCDDFVSRLPETLNRSRSASLSSYPEVRFQNGEAYIQTIIPCTTSTPVFRKVNMDDHHDGVLCSRSRSEMKDPAFYPSTGDQQSKDILDVDVSSVSMYRPPFAVANSSVPEARIYPIVCLEVVGKVKNMEVVTCFPTVVRKSVKIPKKCVISRDKLPGYTAGLLTKLYTLWYMSESTDTKHIVILYSSSTDSFAHALVCLLKGLGAKSVTMITEDDIACSRMHPHSTVVSTVLVTEGLANKLMKNGSVTSLLSLDQLIRKPTIDHILWASSSMTINVLRSTDMYSHSAIQNRVPKMLKWIRSHRSIVFSIAAHLTSSHPETPIPNITHIHIKEVLTTSELDLDSSASSIDCGSINVSRERMFKRNGSYLVVGGLTGLGWECVRYLAERGAGCIVILNRRKTTSEHQVDLNHVSHQFNCTVTSLQADVTNFNDLKTALSRIRRTLSKPIKGIFFGAAVLVDATLAEMSEEKLRTSLAPKVTGVWNMHILTADLPLDFFVLHSSGASVLGNAGQSNYGAGNGFLDGLAKARRQIGLSAQSINWGPLNLGMLATNGSVLKKLESQGYLTIDRRHISQCLNHILMLNEPQILMCRIDKQKMAGHIKSHGERTMMTRLKDYLEPALKLLDSTDNVGRGKPVFNIEQLKECTPEKGILKLQEYIKFLVCEKALLDEVQFEMKTNLRDQGLDSMYAMEVTSQIYAETGVKISTHEVQLQSAEALAKSIQDGVLNKRKIGTEGANTKEKERLKGSVMRSISQSVSGSTLQGKYNIGFVIISTIHIPKVVNLQSLIEAAKECVSRHHVTRTIYKIGTSNIITDVLPVDEAFDFRVVSGSDADIRKLTEEPLLIESQAPIRFHLLKKHLQLRIIFHRMAFDLKAITIFVKELEMAVNTRHQGNIFDGSVVSKTDKNIADEIVEILAPDFEKHWQFWKDMVGLMTRNSFCKTVAHHQQKNDIYISRKLKPKLYAQIMDFTRRNGFTVFEYLASIYQLLLALCSNSSTATVTISVDLRMHVPSLVNSLGRCTNTIPLICKLLDDSTTLAEFMQNNTKDLKQFLNYGLFPSEEIKKLLPDDRTDSFERNFFVFEDDVITNNQNQLEVEMPVVFGPQTETYFYIWQRRNTQTMEIKFHLKKELFTEPRAEAVADAFLGLVLDSLNRPTVSLLEVKKQKYMDMKDEKVVLSKSQTSSLCSLM